MRFEYSVCLIALKYLLKFGSMPIGGGIFGRVHLGNYWVATGFSENSGLRKPNAAGRLDVLINTSLLSLLDDRLALTSYK